MKKPALALLGVAIACVIVSLLTLGLRRNGNGGAQEVDQKRPTDPSQVQEVVSGTLDRSGQGPVSQEGPRVDQPSGSTEEAIGKARRLLSALRTAVQLEDESWRTIADELSGMGSVAVPEIEAAFDTWPPGDGVWLVGLLGGIGGDESTGVLVTLALDDDQGSAAMEALGALENRPIRAPVPEGQQRVLARIIRESNVLRAGLAARVLGNCQAVAGKRRAEAILPGYLKEIRRPSDLGDELHGVYLSPRVYALNQFLLGFSHVGPDAIPVLQGGADQAGTPLEKKWLHLAMGVAGDASMADTLRDIVTSDPDISTRTVAVHAYANAMGRQAIPFLTALLDDKTRGEYESRAGLPEFPIRQIAQGMLHRIRLSTRDN